MYKAVALLLVITGIFGAAPFALRAFGQWLIVEDPLGPASAIVVLGGHLPFRAMEAATLYQQGWAPEVWLTRGASSEEERVLTRLGITVVRNESYSQAVLERLSVPLHAIVLLDEAAKNTADEVQVIARRLQHVGGQRVIIVTSKAHSRRVRFIWQTLIGDSLQVIIRYATKDPYDPDGWWWYTDSALAVCREVLGMLNAWAGFPVQPKAEPGAWSREQRAKGQERRTKSEEGRDGRRNWRMRYAV